MERNAPPVTPATYSVAEVAEILRYSEKTIRRHAETLKAFRVGREIRIPRESVELLCKVQVAVARDLAADVPAEVAS